MSHQHFDQAVQDHSQYKASSDGARDRIERIAHCLPPLLFVEMRSGLCHVAYGM